MTSATDQQRRGERRRGRRGEREPRTRRRRPRTKKTGVDGEHDDRASRSPPRGASAARPPTIGGPAVVPGRAPSPIRAAAVRLPSPGVVDHDRPGPPARPGDEQVIVTPTQRARAPRRDGQRDGDQGESAARQENRNSRAAATQASPSSSARTRLSIADSMKLAGRNTVASIRRPASPGRSSSSASSTPLVTSSVLAPGTSRPRASGRCRRRRAVADQRLVVLDHVGDVAEPQRRGRRPSTGTRRGRPASTIGRMCRTDRRWLGVSMKPPVPGVEASRKVSGETNSALPAVR